MADKKISALTGATTPLAGTEVLPIVQSGATVKVSVANLTAGRAIDATSVNKVAITAPATGATLTIAEGKTLTASNSLTLAGTDATTMTFPTTSATVARTDAANSFTGDQTLTTGNLIIGTSGKGIDFSATPGTGTSELFDDYEEGTWTPTIAPASGAITSYTSSGTYTKIGRQVTINATVTVTDNGTGAGNYVVLGNMPFSATNLYFVGVGAIGNTGEMVSASLATSTTAIVTKYNYGYPTATGYNFQVNLTYFV